MTKALIQTEGTLFVDFRITTGKQQEIVTGQAYSKNVGKNFKQLLNKALLNAIYKYYYYLEQDGERTNIDRQKFIPEEKEGLGQYESGRILDKKLNPVLVVERLNYDIEYDKDLFKIKRIKENNKYYTQIYMKQNDKFVKYKKHRWSYKRFTEDYYIDNTEIEKIEKEQNQRKSVNIKKFRHKKPKI